MKFLNEQGKEITLKRAENLPGFLVTVPEQIVIDSPVNNPFFKGINVLQLPKKLKGFRDNPDLKMLLSPNKIKTNIFLKSNLNSEIVIFEPDSTLVNDKKLYVENRIFGNNQEIVPLFLNLGLKNVKLSAGTKIGTIYVIAVGN